MTPRIHASTALLVLSTALAACAVDPGGEFDFGEGDVHAMDPGSLGSDSAGDGGEESESEPHAHGTVVLGEAHEAGGGQATPVVIASFVPDSETMPHTCAVEVEGCSVETLPDCEGSCGFDEVCAFDGGCVATCQAICDLECGEGQECYFPVAGSAACRAVETFDAGALTFDGTTVPVTLFPPYEFAGDVSGALALPGEEVTVSASGATGAGFGAFERSLVAVQPLQASLDELTVEDAYGTGPMPVRWSSGDDAVRVSLTVGGVTGSYGVVTCETSDSGSFDVPRAAIAAAVPDDEPSSIFVELTRHNTRVHTGLDTVGSLLEATVQPRAWLELVSSSSESTVVEGCGGLAFCGDECVDTTSDAENCGGCNVVCGPSQTCSLGECVDEDTAGGACCASSASPGCSDAGVEACVCAQDSYCCSTAWDATCVSNVSDLGCGVC